MTEENKELNGSVNLLADALHRVFGEAMQDVREGVREDIDRSVEGAERRLNASMNEMKADLKQRIDTTNENMAKQFSHQEGLISSVVDKKMQRNVPTKDAGQS